MQKRRAIMKIVPTARGIRSLLLSQVRPIPSPLPTVAGYSLFLQSHTAITLQLVEGKLDLPTYLPALPCIHLPAFATHTKKHSFMQIILHSVQNKHPLSSHSLDMTPPLPAVPPTGSFGRVGIYPNVDASQSNKPPC